LNFFDNFRDTSVIFIAGDNDNGEQLSPVTTTPAINLLQVTTTPAINLLQVTTTPVTRVCGVSMDASFHGGLY
jgi:hypothetical protein